MRYGSRTVRDRMTLGEVGEAFLENIIQAVEDPARASAEERERRLSICRSCEEYKMGFCRLCKCVTRFKTQLEIWHCELGNW